MTSDRDTARADYRRGRKASQWVGRTGSIGALDRADVREESDAWHEGYEDHATGRPIWHGQYGVREYAPASVVDQYGPTVERPDERPAEYTPAARTPHDVAVDTLRDGGATVDIDTLRPVDVETDTGELWAVGGAIPGLYERPRVDFIATTITNFRARSVGAHSRDVDAVGTWVDPDTGRVEVDGVSLTQHRSTALKLARRRGERAIFDLASGETVYIDEAGNATIAFVLAVLAVAVVSLAVVFATGAPATPDEIQETFPCHEDEVLGYAPSGLDCLNIDDLVTKRLADRGAGRTEGGRALST